MKNLWKFAAALAAIAGSVVLIARYGDKFLARLQKLRDRCCHGGCSCGEKLAAAACEAGEAGCRRGRRGPSGSRHGRGLCRLKPSFQKMHSAQTGSVRCASFWASGSSTRADGASLLIKIQHMLKNSLDKREISPVIIPVSPNLLGQKLCAGQTVQVAKDRTRI